MSSQVNRDQEIWDHIQFLERKVAELEAYCNQQYEDEYDE